MTSARSGAREPRRLRLGTRLLVGAAVLLATGNGVNALNKGGDFVDYVDAGTRFIHGEPLYQGSGVGGGVIGPPFQAVLFAPFAVVAAWSLPVARLSWYVLNLACVVAGVRWWYLALAPARPAGPPGSAAAIVWPLLAVLFPLQTNFEHQNINGVLLALTGLAAWCATQGRLEAAGAWVGVAAAVKVFPMALALVLAARRAWRAFAIAVSAAMLLTLAPVVRYGIDGWIALLQDWWALSGSGQWPIRRHNQSLFAMLGRYLSPADLLTWGQLPETAAPHVHVIWLIASIALLLTVLGGVSRPSGLPEGGLAIALAAGLSVAVLLSPIAWEHYWLLLWPAFAVCYRPPLGSPRWVPAAFWIAAILTSGIARPTVGRLGVALARGFSVRTWAALLVLFGVLAAFHALRRSAPQRIS